MSELKSKDIAIAILEDRSLDPSHSLQNKINAWLKNNNVFVIDIKYKILNISPTTRIASCMIIYRK